MRASPWDAVRDFFHYCVTSTRWTAPPNIWCGLARRLRVDPDRRDLLPYSIAD